MTHVIKEGYGYWDVTHYPYGGCFRRATSAFGVTVLPDEPPSKREVVCTCPGEKGLRRLVVSKDGLASL